MRLYRRHARALPEPRDAYLALTKTFETIGMAKASTSAEEARELGFLGPDDGWSMNGDHRVRAAKAKALGLARSSEATFRAAPIPVMGRGGLALLETGLFNMLEGRFISAHDRKIGREIARVLSGGDVAGPTTVSEQHMLDLERESFLRLCGEPKTHARIEALLKTGKPLRN
jgi:3-hydroxyacyl-CoA dehydrogenase